MSRLSALFPLNAWLRYLAEWKHFRRQMNLARDRGFELSWRDRHPCLQDRTNTTTFDRHYVYHIAWAIRFLLKNGVSHHVDISSSLHFVSTLSASIPVDFYDYRPADIFLSGLQCKRADLTQLPFDDASLESISCLHVLEHIGLGRYGDPIDPDGDLKAISELKRVVRPGGWLLIVVPVGRQRICFNAHRIYDWHQWLKEFDGFKLFDQALIPDDVSDGGLVNLPTASMLNKQSYGCGCFAFQKHQFTT